jgi:hypothetical protein
VHHPHAHQTAKHIDIAHRLVQDRVERGDLLSYVPTNKMAADCLTTNATCEEHDQYGACLPCVFYRGNGRDEVYLLIHVDGSIIIGVKQSVLAARDAALLDVADEGEAQNFLSVEIQRLSRGTVLSQKQYRCRLLKQYRFKRRHCTCKGRDTHMVMHMGANSVKEGALLAEDNQLRAKVGGFLWLARNTRPDISHASTVLKKFLSSPTEEHEAACRHILKYFYKYPDVGRLYEYLPEVQCDPYSGARFSW